MRLFVLRHAIAEDAAAGQPDSERRLTDTGRVKLRRVLRRARQAGVAPGAIVSSPYVRARQTAEVAVEELEHSSPIVETANLTPHGNLFELWNEVRALSDDQTLLVGHNPQLSELVAWMIGAPGYGVEMKKSGLAFLEVYGMGPQPRASLVWLLTPKSAG